MRNRFHTATAIATGAVVVSLAFSGPALAIKIGSQTMVKPSVKVASKINPRPVVRAPVKVRANNRVISSRSADDGGDQTQADNHPPQTSEAKFHPKVTPANAKPNPPAPLPVPRPSNLEKFADEGGLLNMIDLTGLDSLDLGIAVNLHDPDDLLGGLPWNQDEAEDNNPFGENDDEFAGPGESEFGKPGLKPGADELSGLGSGWALFNPAGPNSHTRAAPSTGLRVTPGSIGAAMGGVASGTDNGDHHIDDEDGTHTGRPGGRYTFDDSRGDDGLWDSWIVTHENPETGDKVVVFHDADGRTIERTHANGDRSAHRIPADPDEEWEMDYEEAPGDGKAADTTKLYDPDSVEGGGWVPPWLAEEPKALHETSVAGPGGLPPAPDEATGDGQRDVERTVTVSDLLERYDPDTKGENDNRGRQMSGACVPYCE